MLQGATHHGLGQGASDVSAETVVNTETKSYLARHGPGEVDFFRVWKNRRIAVGGEETNLQGITFPDFLPTEFQCGLDPAGNCGGRTFEPQSLGDESRDTRRIVD